MNVDLTAMEISLARGAVAREHNRVARNAKRAKKVRPSEVSMHLVGLKGLFDKLTEALPPEYLEGTQR